MSENTPHDPRRQIILDAALKAFVTYGYRRTTMADIAKEAGISRPALYLQFSSKDDIYRAKFMELVEETRLHLRAALKGGGTLGDRLGRAARAAIFEPFRMILNTPHGAELFDVKHELGPELADHWFRMFEGGIAEALVADPALPRHVEPSDFARLFVSAMEGIKLRMTDIDSGEADAMRMAHYMARALLTEVA